MPAWTQQQDLILKVYYPYAGPDSLLSLLPGRSLSAIYSRAFQMRIKKIKWPKPPPPPKVTPATVIPKPKPKTKQKSKARVIPKPIKFWPWEKQTLLELGPHLTVIEMKTLIPRRSIAQIRRMAEVFNVKFLGD